MTNDSGMICEQQYKSSVESFNAWLYENYPIGNGDTLLTLQEDGGVVIRYLVEMKLPIDTELV